MRSECQLSCVITARNERPSVLRRTYNGLVRTTTAYKREIIIVDDGSEVPIEAAFPHARLLRNARPLGVSRARRRGAARARGRAIVWLDAHMTFADDWVERMLAHVDSGSLLCSAFWDYDLTTCHCWGADFTWCGERNYWQQRSPGFALRHRTERPGPRAVIVPMVIGACYMMRRDAYRTLGGFSPLLRIWGCDEQDMSARAWLSGCGVKCVTDAKVGHLFRQTFPYPVYFEHLEFNQLAMIRTLFEPATIAALERAFQPVPSRVRTWLDPFKIKPWRRRVQSQRSISDVEFFALAGLKEKLPL